MYYYSENEAYDELREDFIDEFQDQLQERDRGEELKLLAEGKIGRASCRERG